MVTIKDIAKLAGVSSATVSKVLNGKDKSISSKTRERILNIVEEQGYIPNGIAKSLRVKSTKTFGLVIPNVTNPFFSELAKGIEDASEAEGYSLILCSTYGKDNREKQYLKILEEKKVDGAIIAASTKEDIEVIDRVSYPIVLLDRDVVVGSNIGKVIVDNEYGGYIATKHLVEAGCKNIGHITSSLKDNPSMNRHKGMLKALKDFDIEINESLYYYGKFSIDTGYEGAKMITRNNKVDGIFCGNDIIAIGAIRGLKEMGYRVPEDIKIVGYDDIYISKYMDPPLTTVRLPIYSIGSNAVEVLLGMISNNKKGNKRKLIPQLVIRDSAK